SRRSIRESRREESCRRYYWALGYGQGRPPDSRRERTSEGHSLRTQLGCFADSNLRKRPARARNSGVTDHPNRQREEVWTGQSHGSCKCSESCEFLSKEGSDAWPTPNRCS